MLMQVSSVSSFSDEELYRRMRQGDQAAFSELYDRRSPALYRYALYSSGNRATAEEVTHEVFVQMLAPSQAYHEHLGTLEAYLYGMARNQIRSLARRNRRDVQEISPRESSRQGTVLETLIQDEAASALHAAVRELPLRYRDAIVLCDIEERSYEEAAGLMQCPVGTLRSRLHRGRTLLAAKMKRFAQVM
jgi:RNA polymerase sigma-70 factor, ECF subfamily